VSDPLVPPPSSAPDRPAAPSADRWRWLHPFAARRAARQARLLADYHAATSRQARQAQITLVRAGYHLGAAPYGYLPHHIYADAADGCPAAAPG